MRGHPSNKARFSIAQEWPYKRGTTVFITAQNLKQSEVKSSIYIIPIIYRTITEIQKKTEILIQVSISLLFYIYFDSSDLL